MKIYFYSRNLGTLHLVILFSLIVSTTFKNITFASTPSEMADFSLQDLLNLSVEDSKEEQHNTPWEFNFTYKQLRFDGYKSGTNDISIDDVLFSPGEERTDENFPVVPTEITQEVFVFGINYALNNQSSINMNLPYIKQGTDHVSSVSGYENFLLVSDGIGDIAINYSRVLKRWNKQQLTWSIGLSLPTGSIDEEGDTPREPGNQQLPYTMQLGSGTWDIPLGIGYQKNTPTWVWNANLLAKIRTGKNDRDYRLGNRLTFSLSSKWRNQHNVKPLAKLQYNNWGDIRGQDDEITVPNPTFPYPAAITNPRYYGGEKINGAIGLEFPLANQIVTMEIGKPLYQDLNGIQYDEEMYFSVNWDLTL